MRFLVRKNKKKVNYHFKPTQLDLVRITYIYAYLIDRFQLTTKNLVNSSSLAISTKSAKIHIYKHFFDLLGKRKNLFLVY